MAFLSNEDARVAALACRLLLSRPGGKRELLLLMDWTEREAERLDGRLARWIDSSHHSDSPKWGGN